MQNRESAKRYLLPGMWCQPGGAMKRLTLLFLLLLLLTAEADVLHCPECGYENESHYKHCITCGTALPWQWHLSGALCFPMREGNA